MPTFTSEFYYGLLIGILLGFMRYYTLHKNKLYVINQKIDRIINLIEPTKRHNNKPSNINQMATEIRELCEGKGIAASTLEGFYKQKTNPRKRTLETIEEWMDKNKEIDDSDNIINNSGGKEDNEI